MASPRVAALNSEAGSARTPKAGTKGVNPYRGLNGMGAPAGIPKSGPAYTEGENNGQGGNPALGRKGSPKTPYVNLPGAVLNGKMKSTATSTRGKALRA